MDASASLVIGGFWILFHIYVWVGRSSTSKYELVLVYHIGLPPHRSTTGLPQVYLPPTTQVSHESSTVYRVQFRLDDMMRSFIHIVRNNFPMMCPHDVEEISQNLSQNQDPWRTWDDRFLTSIFSNFRDDFLHHVNAFVHHAFENPKFAIAYSQRRG